MKKYYLTILLSFTLIIILLLACQKEEFLKKSLISIENVEHLARPDSVIIDFSLIGELIGDTIGSVQIVLTNGGITDTVGEITLTSGLDLNPVTVFFDSLIPGTDYCYKIIAKTLSPGVKEFYYPPNPDECVPFTTPMLTLKIKKVIEFPDSLKLVAEGAIEDFENINILSFQFGIDFYEYKDSMRDTLIDSYLEMPFIIDNDGNFTFNFYYYDLNRYYTIKAYYINERGERFYAMDFPYDPTSEGNYWVNMATLPGYGEQGIPPAREGAVSFVLREGNQEFAYMGLGYGGDNENNLDLLNDFWRYDYTKNQWEKVFLRLDIPARMFATVIQTGSKVIFGLGCTNCRDFLNIPLSDIDFINDFYSIESSFREEDIMIQTAPLFNVNLGDNGGRIGAYGYEIGSTYYIGGGLGKSVIEGDRASPNLETGTWIDYNGNRIIDVVDMNEWNDDRDKLFEVGNWVDSNYNGIVDGNEERISMAGSWVDLNENDTLDFDEGEWTNQSGGEEEKIFEMGEWKLDTTMNKTGVVNRKIEWEDDGNWIPDPSEFDYKLAARSDLFKLEGNHFNFQYPPNTSAPKYGAATFKNEDGVYLFQGGTLPNSTNQEEVAYMLKGNGGSILENINNKDLPFSRIFPISFKIGNDFYLGAGETTDETNKTKVVSFDLWKLNENNTGFEPMQGCSLQGLTRGISFSLNGRGYVGFGRVGTGDISDLPPSNEFWMYIPKK